MNRSRVAVSALALAVAMPLGACASATTTGTSGGPGTTVAAPRDTVVTAPDTSRRGTTTTSLRAGTTVATSKGTSTSGVATSVPEPGPIRTGKVIVRLHERTEVGTGVAIVLDSIADSRCPADVTCVWEGELEADVTWIDASGPHPLHLTWAYHSPAVPTPSGSFHLALADAASDGSTAELWIVDGPCAEVAGQKPPRC